VASHFLRWKLVGQKKRIPSTARVEAGVHVE
jgi:hypothetical protein